MTQKTGQPLVDGENGVDEQHCYCSERLQVPAIPYVSVICIPRSSSFWPSAHSPLHRWTVIATDIDD